MFVEDLWGFWWWQSRVVSVFLFLVLWCFVVLSSAVIMPWEVFCLLGEKLRHVFQFLFFSIAVRIMVRCIPLLFIITFRQTAQLHMQLLPGSTHDKRLRGTASKEQYHFTEFYELEQKHVMGWGF